MLVVTAEFPIDPEKREEATELVEMLVEESNREPGVLEYRAAWDVSEPNLVRFFERYEDEAAFGAHAESDHVAELDAALPDLLDGEPRIVQFEVSSHSDVEL